MERELPADRRTAHSLVGGELTGKIIECFYRVYNCLGYGFLESVYRNALALELRGEGLDVLIETPIDVFYQDVRVGTYRLDLLVARSVALEVKATELLFPTAKRRLLNYQGDDSGRWPPPPLRPRPQSPSSCIATPARG